MRSILLVSIAAVALAGCGKAASPAATLGMAQAPVATAPVAAPVAAPAAPIAAKAQPSVTVTEGRAPAEAAAALDLPEVEAPTAAQADADDPPAVMAFMAASESAAAEDAPSYNVDDRTPYGVVCAERSAHTATIAWRTELPTRGIIDYGRAWGFKENGYTHQFVDDVAKTDHLIVLTDLRRWTGYVFRVTSVTALGLKFPEQERTFRTKFWSWR